MKTFQQLHQKDFWHRREQKQAGELNHCIWEYFGDNSMAGKQGSCFRVRKEKPTFVYYVPPKDVFLAYRWYNLVMLGISRHSLLASSRLDIGHTSTGFMELREPCGAQWWYPGCAVPVRNTADSTHTCDIWKKNKALLRARWGVRRQHCWHMWGGARAI